MKDDQQALIVITRSPETTSLIGEALGKTLVKGEVVALIGELGSGKTLFTQGIAKGLAISDVYTITSPTFNLINEYPGRLNLYHIDVYRLEGINEMEDIGFEDYLNKEGIIVIEWAEKISELLPHEAIFIYFSNLDETVRKIEIYSKSTKLHIISDELMKEGVEGWL